MQTTGRGPGRISHHTAHVRPSKEVVIYGGLKGEDSSAEIYLFNPNTNAWQTVLMSVSIIKTDALVRLLNFLSLTFLVHLSLETNLVNSTS